MTTHNDGIQEARAAAQALRRQIGDLYAQTKYEDLEHAGLGLEIVDHALEEVLEHTGLGGHINGTPDPAAHAIAQGWQGQVETLRAEAAEFLKTHPSEDLETALKAL
jgi:hypothetical protein